MIDYSLASAQEVWAHQDWLGSTVMVTDANGSVTERFTYSPYGESGGALMGFPFRFTGQKLDPGLLGAGAINGLVQQANDFLHHLLIC